VELRPSLGGEVRAVLLISCALGTPPAGTFEGITLQVKGFLNFNTPVSGFTMFIQVPED